MTMTDYGIPRMSDIPMSLRLYLISKALQSGYGLDEAISEVTSMELANPDLDMREERTWVEWETPLS